MTPRPTKPAIRKLRDRAEKLNMADGLIFNTEKQLKEYGDKVPATEKGNIESALNKLKEAHQAEDISSIDSAMDELNNAWQAASQHMYADGGAQGRAARC